ncbi:GNAT family N-acetyltransferase [Pseudophaeobacter flagellatus]|uniref:GNAT family N-acetyltransferase n=1 Tax=Pseudophaeobacter flagellatus TaxID=2899119 RepID=UPI001E576F21|nr:GNAT family N-acetyltransferase [Pseudophaeobacter flagellatus]MCD9149242.1 GNAT family N-acetyltransferase [Pseudophaeobacter flagellatus]
MTALGINVELRELDGVTELKHAEEFQCTVWGADDPADNSDLMLAIQHEGGLVAGAFVEGRMLGFLFGFPTKDPEVQHSHRLAVHPESRGLGLGARLKWYQRHWCLARGITSVRWTFDPLRRVNANLNIARLGATANVYLPDYYGQMEGINAGIASDRIVADWSLDAARVTRLAEGINVESEDHRTPMHVKIPQDLDALLSNDLDRAISERQRVRCEMTTAFAEGYRIIGFNPADSAYALSII